MGPGFKYDTKAFYLTLLQTYFPPPEIKNINHGPFCCPSPIRVVCARALLFFQGARKVHEDRWRTAAEAAKDTSAGVGTGGRTLREIELTTPIRWVGPTFPLRPWRHRNTHVPSTRKI